VGSSKLTLPATSLVIHSREIISSTPNPWNKQDRGGR
jgi:hypothetical protein